MSKVRRRPRQARARQCVDAILDGAAAILEEEGLAGLNTNAIALRAGVPVGSVYQYFSNKEEIVHELGLRSLGRLDEVVRDLLDRTDEPWEQLVDRVIDRLAALYRTEPGFRTVFLGHLASAELTTVEREQDARFAERLDPLLAGMAPHLKPAQRRLVCSVAVQVTGPILSLSLREPRKRARVLEEGKRLLKAYLREHIEGAP